LVTELFIRFAIIVFVEESEREFAGNSGRAKVGTKAGIVVGCNWFS
jgi:hypothetical protein